MFIIEIALQSLKTHLLMEVLLASITIYEFQVYVDLT